MKNLIALAAAGVSLVGIASAQGYFGAHLGVSSVTDANLSIEGEGIGEVIYDDGVNFGLLGGFQFSKFFAGELEIVGATNDSEFFVGDEDYSVTSFFANAVVSTPVDQRIIVWGGAGAGFASNNIEDGGNGFATQLKVGADLQVVGPHYVSLQAGWVNTDGFRQTQDGTEFEVGYGNESISLGYRFRY
ncbi:hypothetical protein HK107_02130 [Parvularcula sp. ZS-1/3]|uniref:Outer membrane protein beta-barrel domain-containing protein n=1 Tax=Parvularcula mediterranea TaxID=2732508 RepID=A0A7Y3RJE7_9PROT|nr:hypothetical protein [Parvularcula mediterranea]NNU15121.1 hypothetical protein [Parvularcula mediterranea]